MFPDNTEKLDHSGLHLDFFDNFIIVPPLFVFHPCSQFKKLVQHANHNKRLAARVVWKKQGSYQRYMTWVSISWLLLQIFFQKYGLSWYKSRFCSFRCPWKPKYFQVWAINSVKPFFTYAELSSDDCLHFFKKNSLWYWYVFF